MLAERVWVGSPTAVAVTAALPGAIPVTLPLAETVAIAASLVTHVTGTTAPFRVALKSSVDPWSMPV
jgi:hypothetical protein